MKPVRFMEQNVTFAKDQPEYLPLPAFRGSEKEGYVTSCWEFSFWERLKLLIRGRLWLQITTFNHSLQPIFMTTNKKEVLNINKKMHEQERARLFQSLKNLDKIGVNANINDYTDEDLINLTNEKIHEISEIDSYKIFKKGENLSQRRIIP